MGFGLIGLSVLLLISAWAYEAIYKFVREADFALMALGVVSLIAGVVYIFSGFNETGANQNKKKGTPQQDAQPNEAVPSAKTGPGWHCSWCWAPLPEGSRFCNKCGRELK